MKHLHEYQLKIIKRIEEKEKNACWLDCGLGKTIITLTAIRKLLDAGKIHKALVVAPKGIAENVWKQEAGMWEHTKSLRVQLVLGTEKQRLKALFAEADIYVISRDNMHWLFQQEAFRADMLVIDESTSFKDRSTRRWASLMQSSITVGSKKLRRKQPMIEMFKRVLLLSGTPASESYQGLWAQIAILCPHDNPLGRTISAFRTNYMIPQMIKGYPVYIEMQHGAIDRINKKLEGLCISMKSEDYLQLPDRIDIARKIKFEDKLYKKMEKDGVVSVDGVDITAGDALTKYGKMQQITAGFIYDEDKTAHALNKCKLEALQEILEGTDEAVLVMYRYEYEKQQLMKLGAVPLESPDAIQQWQQRKIKVGLLYPSCAYGLNIQQGSIMIWYTLPLSLEQYIQSVRRLWRQGQQKPVRVYHMLCSGTIDEHIYHLLQEKKDVLNGLMEYFKN